MTPANAQATQGIPRTNLTPTTTLQLSGDANPTAIKALWETDLDNLDSFQDNTSIAVDGTTLYLCVNYLDSLETGDKSSSIFIRRFDTLTGAEFDPWIIPCPEKYILLHYSINDGYELSGQHNMVIANDTAGNLLLACFRSSEKYFIAPKITFIPLSPEGRMMDEYVAQADCMAYSDKNIYYPGYGLNRCSITKIDRIEGDILSGEYKANVLLGIDTKTKLYDYAVFEVTDHNSAKFTSIKRLDFRDQPFYEYEISRPDFHLIAGQKKYALITLPSTYDKSDTPGAPMLYYDTNNDYCATNRPMSLDRGVFAAAPDPQEPCIGIQTFMHGNHTMAVYPHHFSQEGGAQFILAEWTDIASFDNLANCFTILPETPFAHPRKIFASHYRQLAATRTVAPSEASAPQQKDAAGTYPETDIFICTPGSGIAAYRLTQPDHLTEAAPVTLQQTYLSLNGRTLSIADFDPTASTPLTITDMQGRIIRHHTPATANVALDDLSRGTYIATYGSTCLKIVI